MGTLSSFIANYMHLRIFFDHSYLFVALIMFVRVNIPSLYFNEATVKECAITRLTFLRPNV